MTFEFDSSHLKTFYPHPSLFTKHAPYDLIYSCDNDFYEQNPDKISASLSCTLKIAFHCQT